MSSFQVTIHEDQPARKAFAETLNSLVEAWVRDNPQDDAEIPDATRDEWVKSAVEQWGLPYAQRLWNAALTKALIKQNLEKQNND